MSRYKTFDATGVAPGGRLYSGDLNAIQDQMADLTNFGQTISASAIRIGSSDIALSKYGAAEAKISAALHVDKILTAIGGIIPGTMTTTQRDAVVAPPTGLTIFNTTTGRFETNIGTSGAPNWQSSVRNLVNGDIAAGAGIQKSKLAALAIVDADVTGPISVTKLSAGSEGQALKVVSGVPTWASIGGSYPGSYPIVNADVSSSAALAVSKLAPGANGKFLGVASGVSSWLDAPGSPQYLSVAAFQGLTSPADGTHVIVIIDSSSHVYWHFRYNAAGGTYKWEFLGGAPLLVEADTFTALSDTSGGFIDLSDGPSVNVALKGEFIFKFGATVYQDHNPSGTQDQQMEARVGLSLNGSAPGANDFITQATVVASITAHTVFYQSTTSKPVRATLTSAGQVAKLQYYCDEATGSTDVALRWLEILPTVVGQ